MFRVLVLFYYTCTILSLVVCDEVMELKKTIVELTENSQALAKDNVQLEQQLEAVKQKCEADLAPLREQHNAILAQNEAAVNRLGEVSQNITALEHEESLLVKALNREVVMEYKFKLKILLTKQELELYTMRRESGEAEKCHKLKPLYDKYGSAITARSMGGGIRKQKSSKDYVIVLQNQLNQAKILVQKEQTQNNRLRNEIAKQDKLCMASKINLQEQIHASQTTLRESLKNLDIFELELKEMVNIVNQLNHQLVERKELNRKLEEEALQLKQNLQNFRNDVECYHLVSGLKVNYK